jgi:hypothetical protein
MRTRIIVVFGVLILTLSQSIVFGQIENKKLFENGSVLISQTGTFRGRNVELSNEQYSPFLLGVYYDENPEVLEDPRKYKVPVKTAGMTYVRFTDKNGKIKKGDPVTSSNIPGVAMKATDSGMILGVALEDANDSSGLLRIRVMVQYVR